eukprot:Seg1999.1 transcript_id=Seg1999.1/GoldUCD/mRNA.D3Y31 product="hypothetical protein" protein_id=Seg1999.1/GoldUCD/D3Y31
MGTMVPKWTLLSGCFVVICLVIGAAQATFLQHNEIVNISEQMNKPIGNLSSQPMELNFFSLIGVDKNRVSNYNFSMIQSNLNTTAERLLFESITIGEMSNMTNTSLQDVLRQSGIFFLKKFQVVLSKGRAIGKLPLVYAAFKEGVALAKLKDFIIIDLVKRITGISDTVVKKLYAMPDDDYMIAKTTKFGQIPQIMNSSLDLKYFYSLSFESMSKALLIDKNITEGSVDFQKDFGYIIQSVSFMEIKNIYGIDNNNLWSHSVFTLSLQISGIKLPTLQKIIKEDTSSKLSQIPIGEIQKILQSSQSSLNTMTMLGLFGTFANKISTALMIAKQPIVYAAFKEGISITQLKAYKLLSLASNVTGLTSSVIKTLYNISDSDFGIANSLPFGALPAYAKNQTRQDSQLKHYYTMSFDSIAKAMLIHKSVTEGTKDFVKDFRYILTKVTFAKLEQIYSINHATVVSHTIASLSFELSGIDLMLLKSSLGVSSNMFLNETKISDMMTMLKLNQSQLNALTIQGILRAFSAQITKGLITAKQPIVYAAFLKGIRVSDLAEYNLFGLAVKLTGINHLMIKTLYNISDSDFGIANSLPFGALPAYAKNQTRQDSQLKHYYTMSFDSIAKAMLIHKNVTEGTKDFVKDFRYILTKVTFAKLEQLYSISHATVVSHTIASLSFELSGIDFMLLKSSIGVSSNTFLNETKISDMMAMLKLNQSQLNALTIQGILRAFSSQIIKGLITAKQPIVYAAFLKGIQVSDLARHNLFGLAVKLTGISKQMIKTLYNISDSDFGTANSLSFGALPAYVKNVMKQDSMLKHYYTMSFDSIAKAMLIHKNVTEGTKDFVKDFRYILTKVTFAKLEQIYSISHATVVSHTIASLSFELSGIDFMLLKSSIGVSSNTFLNETKISDMMAMLKLNQSQLNALTIQGILRAFSSQITKGLITAKQPIVYAAFLKGIQVSDLARHNLFGLAVKLTGISKQMIKTLYNISDSDFGTANSLSFGALPAYVKNVMKQDSLLKHYYTMSFDSIAKAMLIHKNVTEGTKDFVKDFRYVLIKVPFSMLKQMYSVNESTVLSHTVASFCAEISGIDFMLLQSAIGGFTSIGFNINRTKISEITRILKMNQSDFDSMAISQLLKTFSTWLSPRIVRSKQPIVYAAYLKGISLIQLANFNVTDLAVNLTGLPESVIKGLYFASDAQFIASKGMMFGLLPVYAKQITNSSADLRHFYTLSLDSLAKAIFLHRSAAEGIKDFIKDFTFIASQIKLNAIMDMYSINNAVLGAMALPELIYTISGANFSLVQQRWYSKLDLLQSFTIQEGLYFLKYRSQPVVLSRTSINQLLSSLVINSGQEPAFFIKLNELKLSNLMAASLRDIVLSAKLPPVSAEGLLKASLISPLYYRSIQATSIRMLLSTSVLSITSQNLGNQTVMKLLQSVRGLKAFAALPIIVAGYYHNISVSQITKITVAQVAQITLGLQINVIAAEFKLQSAILRLIGRTTFEQLATFVSQQIGGRIDFRQLYHLSFHDLFDAVLTRKSLSDSIKAIEKSIRFIALNMTLHDIKIMFEISHNELMKQSLIDLSAKYSNVSLREIRVALNLTVQQERLLARVLFGHAIFQLSTERIGHRIINLGTLGLVLFTSMKDLLHKYKKPVGELSTLPLNRFLALGSVSTKSIDDVMRKMKISKETQVFINAHSLGDFAVAQNVPLATFATWDIFKLLWEIKSLMSKGATACKKFQTPCPAHAFCNDPKDHLFCRCKPGFSGDGSRCYGAASATASEWYSALAMSLQMLISFVYFASFLSQVLSPPNPATVSLKNNNRAAHKNTHSNARKLYGSGSDWFKDFAKDPYVRNKFLEVATAGLQKFFEHNERSKNVAAAETEPEDVPRSSPDLDQETKQTLLSTDMLSLSVHEKSALIGRIVRRNGKTKIWSPMNKPVWFWPDSVEFRSPNAGPNRMRVADMDLVLQACSTKLREQVTQDEQLIIDEGAASAGASNEPSPSSMAHASSVMLPNEGCEQSFVVPGSSQRKDATKVDRLSQIKKQLKVLQL